MGLAGSGHCVAMCGGVASSMSLSTRGLHSVYSTLCYNLGRLISYAIAGALVGGVSAQFGAQNTLIALWLKVFSGVFIILVGFYVMRLFNVLAPIESLGKWAIWQHLVKFNRYLVPIDSYPKALTYGALWGWLPCGLVYSALTWTMTSQSAIEGALFMVAFALGTLPAMLTLGIGAQGIGRILNQQWVRLCLGNLLIWYGLYSVIVALSPLLD